MEGTRIGVYQVESELGSGAMGTVHLARVVGDAQDLKDGQRVAIKLLHPHLLSQPGFFKRFMREAEVGRQVDHENVVRTFDVDALDVEGKTAEPAEVMLCKPSDEILGWHHDMAIVDGGIPLAEPPGISMLSSRMFYNEQQIIRHKH